MSDAQDRLQVMAGLFEDALEDEGFSPEGYEVLEELDHGGMAVVYLARQLEPLREVALKVVLPRFAGEEEIRERFQREGRAMAALEHPGVLPVYQVGEWDGMAFIAMKLATGGTLQSFLAKESPSPKEAVTWLIAAGEAVHFAHQRGVLHRDLKPGNLLFDEEGKAKLEFAGDGGLTKTEALVGTPHYLSPEVAAGTASGGSVSTDLYGLGAVLYECLTGKRPYEGAENLAAQLRAVVDEELVPLRKIRPELSKDLAVICEKALAKTAEERYPTVADFVEDLSRWQDGRDILARPASLPEKMWRWAKRYPLAASLAGLLLLTVLGGSVLLLDRFHESLIAQARAERLVQEPGFRDRALLLLEEADGPWRSEKIREEAVATLAYWDIGGEPGSWSSMSGEDPFQVREIEEGVQLVERDSGKLSWKIKGDNLHCDPAFSTDGRFLALVRIQSMEVVIYDISRGRVFADVKLRAWPESLEFCEKGELLKVMFPEGKASLLSVRGDVLLEYFDQEQGLREPVGFTAWPGQFLTAAEASPYGGQLSRSGRFLATTSSVGVQIWDVAARRAVDFYEVENQQVDAPTDAWWLDDERLLVQVPGGRR